MLSNHNTRLGPEATAMQGTYGDRQNLSPVSVPSQCPYSYVTTLRAVEGSAE